MGVYNTTWMAPNLHTSTSPRGCNNFISISEATTYYNLIDHPVGVIPVCRVDAKKDQVTDEWWKESGHGSKILERGLFGSGKPLYSPEQIHGMPIAIQLVGQRWEDESVLAMMKIVDTALGSSRGFGPGAWDLHSSWILV